MRKATLLALSLLGLFDSGYLWWVYSSPSRPMVCMGGGCDVVRASPLAHLRGVPLPFFGVVMYAVLALLIFSEPLVSDRFAKFTRYAVGGISGVGFLISLYLTGVEAFVLHAWCTWCVVSALCVTAIFVLSVFDLRRPAQELEPAARLEAVRTQFVVFLVALTAGTPAISFLSRRGELRPTSPVTAADFAERLVRPDSHVAGNPQGAVTVVEFADFQCPYCGQAEQAARQIRKQYGNDVRFVFRQFPIEGLHPLAEKTAEAGECAAEQGKFWEAVDKFYDEQKDLSEAALVRYARQLGLNTSQFQQCLSSGKMASRVRRDMEDASALGVRATPTFFIGRQKVEGPLDFGLFSKLVEQELSSPGVALARSQALPRTIPGGQALKQPDSHPSSKHAKDPNTATSGMLGSTPGGVFSQFQTSGLACSEEEAKKEQPTLIRTPEAHQLFKDGSKALFVDVRPAKEFVRGRIPGAINVPADEIEQRWSRLPKDRVIIFYESGRAAGDVCAFSRAAGRVLLAHGFPREQVKVYQDGLAGWEKASLPVEY